MIARALKIVAIQNKKAATIVRNRKLLHNLINSSYRITCLSDVIEQNSLTISAVKRPDDTDNHLLELSSERLELVDYTPSEACELLGTNAI